MNHHIKSDDKVKEKNSEVFTNLTSQETPKVSAPPTKAPSNQNKVSDFEPKQEPSKKEDDSPKVKCALVANIEILKQPFTVGIQKEGDDIYFGGSAKFKGFNLQEFINGCKFIPNIIPNCISNIEFSGITVAGNIKIPEKSKDNASEQNKTINITIELETNNGYIKFNIEKPIVENEEDENKSLYWTLTYGPKKQDRKKNTDNDSEIQVVTENDRGIKVSKLISDFAQIVLKPIGIELDTDSLPEFIKNFTITGFTATNKPPNDSKPSNSNQDEPKEEFIDITIDTSLGSVEVQSSAPKEKPQNEIEDNSTKDSDEKTWSITYKTRTDSEGLNIHKLPVAGEILNLLSPPSDESKYEVKLTEIAYSKTSGLSISFYAFGNDKYTINLPKLAKQKTEDPELKPQENMLMATNDATDDESESGLGFTGKVVWKKIEKTFSVLSIPKIGIGLDHKRVVFLLDVSLNVSPLTFSLKEAGLGIVPDFKKFNLKFYLSGFAISFDNGVLSIGGGFYVSKDEQNEHPEYIGELAIRFKEIGLTAIGSYSAGSMWAYLVLSAPIGGIPAFFVKGLAAGFGYNRRLNLPSIEDVKDYPLITAAQKGSAGSDIIGQLEEKHYIEKEDGQYFLAAGIKFTSFQIINGFILATVSFGNDCELGLLGLADITVPPNVSDETKCLAKAQLAISASVKPLEGEFKAEAQLTNESYILTKECKLTGGFAAYAWFGENKHRGDFVVSLGGYHPSFNKPDHYPDVPRLGLNWQVNKNISIVGEMYFALTPSCLMAGGKLCATYTQGDLKAWFIAYANMIMNWKPFWYDVSIGVTLGASYTVDFLFVKNTFSVEMEANLYLQGPKLHGKIDVSWYIISFTIEFGDEPQKEELSWDDFIDSFFVEQKTSSNKILNANKENEQNDIDPRSESILTISLEGVVGKIEDNEKAKDVISARQLEISALSKIPIGESINVRPLLEGHDTVNSTIEVHVMRENGEEINNFNSNQIDQKLPAALWGDKKSDVLTSENSLVKLVCGKKQSIIKTEPALFPSNENRWITLQELYEKNKISYGACFAFFAIDENFSLSYNEKTIEEFTENEKNINAGNRDSYITNMLQKYGVDILEEHVSIEKFAKNADSLLSENIMIIDVEGEKWYEPRRETI